MKKQLNNEKGLTLIELLAVIVILAIIAAIAVPAIGNIIAKSNDRAILADASTVLSGAKLAIANNECKEDKTAKTITCNATVLKSYVEKDIVTGNDTTGDKVVKETETNEYTIHYANFKEIKKITVDGLTQSNGTTTSDTLTEEKLLAAMGKN